jgi:hypothetical protein
MTAGFPAGFSLYASKNSADGVCNKSAIGQQSPTKSAFSPLLAGLERYIRWSTTAVWYFYPVGSWTS